MERSTQNFRSTTKLGYVSAVLLLIAMGLNILGVIPVVRLMFSSSVKILATVGFALLFIALYRWGKSIAESDAASLMKIRVSVILLIVGYVCAVPLIVFIGYMLMYLYLGCFKSSATVVSAAGKSGLSKISLALLLATIAAAIGIIGLIPALGIIFNIIAAIIYLVAFIIYLLGWKAIDKAAQ